MPSWGALHRKAMCPTCWDPGGLPLRWWPRRHQRVSIGVQLLLWSLRPRQDLCSRLDHWIWTLATNQLLNPLPCWWLRLEWWVESWQLMSWDLHFINQRWSDLTQLPWRISPQPWQSWTDHCGEWEDIETWVHTLCCCWISILLPRIRLCQNHRRGRDDLDGQQLRQLWSWSIFFLLLPAAVHDQLHQHSGDLLPHRWLGCSGWLESWLDRTHSRWVS